VAHLSLLKPAFVAGTVTNLSSEKFAATQQPSENKAEGDDFA
jgi:hypothetical protein